MLSSQIIQAAIKVHNELGPGLLESVYQKCLAIELEDAGVNFKAEVQVPVVYRNKTITDDGFRIDILFDPRLGIKPPPRLCALERSGRDNKMAYSRATEGAKGNRNR